MEKNKWDKENKKLRNWSKKYTFDERGIVIKRSVKERLEYLREQIRKENISYGEIAELQGLAKHIESNDVELLEWAGVKENNELQEGEECEVCGRVAEQDGECQVCKSKEEVKKVGGK